MSPTTAMLLCPADVLNVVPVYRPTLKFVTKILAIIGLTGESALTRGGADISCCQCRKSLNNDQSDSLWSLFARVVRSHGSGACDCV
jgi:hypothetical protein